MSEERQLLGHLFYSAPPTDKDVTTRGLFGSLLLHAAILGLLIWAGRTHAFQTVTDFGTGTGITAGTAGGGGGGEDVAYIELAAPPPAAAATPLPELQTPLPEIVPEITPPEVPPPQVATTDVPPIPQATISGNGVNGTAPAAGSGSGAGPGQGPGSGGGNGGGEGGGVGSGVGPGTGKGRILAPNPEFLLIPPTAPGSVRGKTVIVRLAIDETGIVRGVELVPATGDRGYDKELKRVAMGWKFKPARDPSNNPVAVQFDVTFNF